MRSTSIEFRKKMQYNTDFYQTAHIEFADGRTKELGKKDFYITGNMLSDGAGTSAFPLGEAMAKRITVVLVNDDDRFSDYDFQLAKITVYLKYDLSQTTESLLFGTFTVTEPESYGTQVTVEAMDDMYKGDVQYTTGLAYPATIGEIMRDSCLTCGVTLLTTSFLNSDYTVKEMPENITHRQLWGLCAMLAGGNTRMDEHNRLKVITYDFSYFEKNQFRGGVFDDGNPYETGDDLNGGNFNPWDDGDTANGGTFADMQYYHVFYKHKTPSIATDDVVITGIQTEVDDTTYLFGAEGYVLNISNQLIENDPQTAVNLIGALLVGIRFRPFSIEHTAYPLAEFGDLCYVADRKGNVYQSVITDIDFSFFGRSTIKCAADSPLRNSSRYNSANTQAIVAARKETAKQITAYDLAVQRLTNLITQSFGVFKTEEAAEDGSVIYYLHNKPELASSTTIWKMTADALAVSTDGGKTWNAGLDSSGNAVVNVLSAIGINADWINTGHIAWDKGRGGTLTLGGNNNTSGLMQVYDASGKLVGYWNKDGLYAKNADIEGKIKSNSAEITGGTFRVETESTNENLVWIKSSYNSQELMAAMAAYGFAVSYGSYASTFMWQGLEIPNGYLKYLEGKATVGAEVGYISTLISSALSAATGSINTLTLGSEPIVSSDKNLKNSIESLDKNKAAEFIYSLNPCRFKYNNGTSDRYHHGFIAQEIKEAMGDEDWGLYVDSEIKGVAGEESRKAIRDGELIADIIAAMQTLNDRVTKLEEKEEN